MKRILRSIRVSGLMILVVLLTTSCLFSTTLDIFVGNNGLGRLLVSFSTNATISPCSEGATTNSFSCTYFLRQSEQQRESEVTLSGLEILAQILLDPLVLQVPLAANDFAGTFVDLQPGSNIGGSLVITAGLNSVRADATQTIQAEPGMQLVIIDLPQDAPTAASLSFNFNFTVPEDTTSLDVKAIFTGRVEVDEETFYPPLLPCTINIASLPAISIPLPDGGLVPLPTNSLQGCNNAVYSFEEGVFQRKLLLPLARK